jgi:hypothetical protein
VVHCPRACRQSHQLEMRQTSRRQFLTIDFHSFADICAFVLSTDLLTLEGVDDLHYL